MFGKILSRFSKSAKFLLKKNNLNSNEEINPRVCLYFSLFSSLLFGSHSILLNRDQLKQWYPDYLTRTNFTLKTRGIDEISADTFAGLTQIQFIDLSENMVSSLDPLVFKGLIQIETLYLTTNNLANLNGTIFSGLSQLKELVLYYNRIILGNNIFFFERCVNQILPTP